jgi:hypothetical protein
MRSNLRAWWRCTQGHVWKARVEDRTRNASGCPQCWNERRRSGALRRPSIYAERVRAMREQGASFTAIAKVLGVPRTSALRWARQAGS